MSSGIATEDILRTVIQEMDKTAHIHLKNIREITKSHASAPTGMTTAQALARIQEIAEQADDEINRLAESASCNYKPIGYEDK